MEYPFLIYFRPVPSDPGARIQVARIPQARDVESAFVEGAGSD